MVNPPNTSASAWPRRSGAVIEAAIAAATGVIMPAPTAISARASSTNAKLGAAAIMAPPTANNPSAKVRRWARWIRPVNATSSGEETA